MKAGKNTDSKTTFSWCRLCILLIPVLIIFVPLIIPAFHEVKYTSADKATLNNLRMLASAAQQYMLDTGAESVAYDDLVGTNGYLEELHPGCGENYSEIVITPKMTRISITLEDGRTVNYKF